MSSDDNNPAIQGIPEDELRARGVAAETMTLGPELDRGDGGRGRGPGRGGDPRARLPLRARLRCRGDRRTCSSHARLLRALAGAGRPVIVVSFGSPYLLRQFPEVPVYVAAYGAAESSQRAAMGALFGEFLWGASCR